MILAVFAPCQLEYCPWMSSKHEPVIWLRDTGHIGIHGWADGRTDVRTDVHDVMAIKPNFLTSMGYHIFLTMVLCARAPSAHAELCYKSTLRSLPKKTKTIFTKLK